MQNAEATSRPRFLAGALAVALTVALSLVGVSGPAHAVGPDALGTINLEERPIDVAVNSAGDRYVTHNYGETVLVYPHDSDDADLDRSLTGFSDMNPAWGIAFDSNDRAFVSVPSSPNILVFEAGATTPNATVLSGADPDEMVNPLGLAVDSNDNLYVANTATGDDSVYVFTPDDTQPDSEFPFPDPALKIEDPVFLNPKSLAVNGSNDLYVGGSGLGTGVWVVPAGTTSVDHSQTRPGLINIDGLAISSQDDLFVGNGTSVAVFPEDSLTASAGRTLTGIGQVQGIAIAPDNVTDPEGTIYVGDYANRDLLRFSPAPVLAVDKAEVDFAEVLKNETKTETITISNSAGQDLIMGADPFDITGADAARFAVTATTCESAVLVRVVDSCTVDIRYSPTSRAVHASQLEITSSAPDTPYVVALAGRGVAPVLNPNPDPYSYGEVPVASDAVAKEYTIQNSGDAPLVFPASSVSIAGVNPEPFAITADSCADTSVDPEGTCAVTVEFNPSADGAVAANLQFDPLAPEVTRSIEMTGTGILPGFSASDDELEFTTTAEATAPNNYSAQETVTITSVGTQDLTFEAIGVTLTGTDQGDFTITAETCSDQVVAPETTCAVTVLFDPATVGTKSASLDFANDAPDSPQSVDLIGNAEPAAPEISLSHDRKDFTDFTLNSSSPKTHTFTVTNSGTGPLAVSDLAIGGTDSADFAVLPSSTCADGPVAVDSTCEVTVQFNPTAIGDKSATLDITSDAEESPHTLPLTGSAISLAAVPGRASAGSGANGQVSVSWPAPSHSGNSAITGYRVQVSTSPAGGFGNAGGSCSSSATKTSRSCIATGLANGTAYYFKVAAINAVGTSEYSLVSAGAVPDLGIQAQTLAKCTLAKSLKKKGGTKLQKGACVTNAGQRATIKVKLKGKGKKTAKVKQKATKIKIKGKGDPLKVVLKIKAPAIAGYTAFSSKVKYKAK